MRTQEFVREPRDFPRYLLKPGVPLFCGPRTDCKPHIKNIYMLFRIILNWWKFSETTHQWSNLLGWNWHEESHIKGRCALGDQIGKASQPPEPVIDPLVLPDEPSHDDDRLPLKLSESWYYLGTRKCPRDGFSWCCESWKHGYSGLSHTKVYFNPYVCKEEVESPYRRNSSPLYYTETSPMRWIFGSFFFRWSRDWQINGVEMTTTGNS